MTKAFLKRALPDVEKTRDPAQGGDVELPKTGIFSLFDFSLVFTEEELYSVFILVFGTDRIIFRFFFYFFFIPLWFTHRSFSIALREILLEQLPHFSKHICCKYYAANNLVS